MKEIEEIRNQERLKSLKVLEKGLAKYECGCCTVLPHCRMRTLGLEPVPIQNVNNQFAWKIFMNRTDVKKYLKKNSCKLFETIQGSQKTAIRIARKNEENRIKIVRSGYNE